MPCLRSVVAAGLLLALAAAPALAETAVFEATSLIVPMDTDHQDDGMLKAFGLVHALLRNDVPVSWVIDDAKAFGGVDFTTDAAVYTADLDDLDDATTELTHAYRAGPFVIASEHAQAARTTIDLWQALHTTTVHVATASFVGHVTKQLVAAPSIGVFADGNEHIAFGYLNAAAIPDSLGQPWPPKKKEDYAANPDVLTADAVAGPTDTDHADGALFADGIPVFCQLMTMHWDVKKAQAKPEVVAEMREYLQNPVHLFAECQAVNAIENSVHGGFVTPNGFQIGEKPDAVEFHNGFLAFAQMDGAFQTVGGSEPAYTLPEGDAYFDKDIVMVTEAGSGIGVKDVWMTGFVDGACSITGVGEVIGGGPPPTGGDCNATVGKVSYLGGHKYSLDTPISKHPDTQGTRLFLNSLFEADCAAEAGQPVVTVTKEGPAVVDAPQAMWAITVTNFGPGPALAAEVTDPLPDGTAFVEASAEGTYGGDAHSVTWDLDNLAEGDSVTLTVTVTLDAKGLYANQAAVDYVVGLNDNHVDSNLVETVYDDTDTDEDGCVDAVELAQGTKTDDKDTDDDGAEDCDDICPLDFNPLQDLATDPSHCGGCGVACGLPDNAAAVCDNEDCVFDCLPGWLDANESGDDGCECAAGDPACDGGAGDAGEDAGGDVADGGPDAMDVGEVGEDVGEDVAEDVGGDVADAGPDAEDVGEDATDPSDAASDTGDTAGPNGDTAESDVPVDGAGDAPDGAGTTDLGLPTDVPTTLLESGAASSGCGCRVSGDGTAWDPLLVALMGLWLGLGVRRRRRPPG